MPYPIYRVVRYRRATRTVLAVVASELTMDAASELARTLRTETEDAVGYGVESMPLRQQAGILDVGSMADRLAGGHPAPARPSRTAIPQPHQRPALHAPASEGEATTLRPEPCPRLNRGIAVDGALAAPQPSMATQTAPATVAPATDTTPSLTIVKRPSALALAEQIVRVARGALAEAGPAGEAAWAVRRLLDTAIVPVDTEAGEGALAVLMSLIPEVQPTALLPDAVPYAILRVEEAALTVDAEAERIASGVAEGDRAALVAEAVALAEGDYPGPVRMAALYFLIP